MAVLLTFQPLNCHADPVPTSKTRRTPMRIHDVAPLRSPFPWATLSPAVAPALDLRSVSGGSRLDRQPPLLCGSPGVSATSVPPTKESLDVCAARDRLS